jgi:hypothetical protein
VGEKFGGGGKRQTERKEAVTGRPPAMWALLLHTWARSLDAAFAVASGWGNYAAAADRLVGRWGRGVSGREYCGRQATWRGSPTTARAGCLRPTCQKASAGSLAGGPMFQSHPAHFLAVASYKFISGVSKIFSAMRTIIKNIKCKLMVKYIL